LNIIHNTNKHPTFFLAKNHLQEIVLISSTKPSTSGFLEEKIISFNASQIFQILAYK